MNETRHTCQNRIEADRRPLTEMTWNIVGTIAPRGRAASVQGEVTNLGWDAQYDLACELAAETHLTVEQARTLVTMTMSGLPVELTWNTGVKINGKIEVAKAVVMFDYLRLNKDTTNAAYIRYTGFGHPLSLSQIMVVKAPSSDTVFLKADELNWA